MRYKERLIERAKAAGLGVIEVNELFNDHSGPAEYRIFLTSPTYKEYTLDYSGLAIREICVGNGDTACSLLHIVEGKVVPFNPYN